ncbi:MAG: STAS domain-containing protein [Akkermansia sp.]|nr:STAS domain-containing protein [Akkermansia sp.]
MTDASLIYHEFDDCLWIRCTSRGSFVNSPTLKTLSEKYIARGGRTIVVDMEICPGVDSTFMGTMAGLARKMMTSGGVLQIATPTQRTRAAMESLGLDMLVDIDPADAPWQENIGERRTQLSQDASKEAPADTMNELERTRHVLDAHNTLRTMNHKNNETFGYVCETLEEDLMRHEAELSADKE